MEKADMKECEDDVPLKYKLYLFYNDYETSYTICFNHARWHRVPGGNPPVWLADHMTIDVPLL